MEEVVLQEKIAYMSSVFWGTKLTVCPSGQKSDIEQVVGIVKSLLNQLNIEIPNVSPMELFLHIIKLVLSCLDCPLT